jgi:hypothetical protein
MTGSWKQIKAMTQQQWAKFSCGFSLLVGKRAPRDDRAITKPTDPEKDRAVR